MREKYLRVEDALRNVEEKGYGIVMPDASEMKFDEPKLVRQQGSFGVKVCAVADSIHMIKTGIRTELCPVVGSEEQTAEVVKYLSEELANNPEGVCLFCSLCTLLHNNIFFISLRKLSLVTQTHCSHQVCLSIRFYF